MQARPQRIVYVGPTGGADPLGIDRVAAARRTPEGALHYTVGGREREVWATSDAERAFADAPDALNRLRGAAVDAGVTEALE